MFDELVSRHEVVYVMVQVLAVVIFKKDGTVSKHFPDGCYIRPWRPCHHLSVDTVFRKDYNEWHSSSRSQRSQLALMVFPVTRPHRCREGTYCTDMIPGMKAPVCWCAPSSDDKKCRDNEKIQDIDKRVPLGTDFQQIRKQFLHLIIHSNDMETECLPELNVKVDKLMNATGMDPTLTGGVQLMKELIAFANEPKENTEVVVKVCDFRQFLFCDPVKKKCRGKTACEPGKIHLGRGVCAVNNGFACQTTEECVENAKCRMVKGTTDSVCMCEYGYGDKCSMENAAFFSRFFHPIISGFKGDEFIRRQEKISTILEAWEDAMTRKVGDSCDPEHDDTSVAIVEYFGNLKKYDPARGDALLTQAKAVIQNGPKLCMYTKFLRCDKRTRKCVPMIGKKMLTNPVQNQMNPDPASALENKMFVQVEGGVECDTNKLPAVFQDMVAFICEKGYMCKQDGETATCAPDCGSNFAPEEACRKQRQVVELKREPWELADPGNGESGESDGRSISGRQSGGPSSSPSTLSSSSPSPLSSSSPSTLPSSSPSPLSSSSPSPLSSSSPSPLSSSSPSPLPSSSPSPLPSSSPSPLPSSSPSPLPSSSPSTLSSSSSSTPSSVGTGMPINETETTTDDGFDNSTDTTTMTMFNNETITDIIGPEENDTTTETTFTETPVIEPPPPPRKAEYGETCMYNDDATLSEDMINEACEKAHYLVCNDRRCDCAAGLEYRQSLLSCAVPLGQRCDEATLKLPQFMDYKNVQCLNGACVKDNGRDICRPETDDLLLIVTFGNT